MTADDPRLDRRTALRAGGATVAASLAGCTALGSLAGDDDLVLDPPENSERAEDVDLPYPEYGQELPEVTVPAPLHDREVTTTEFVGERHAMLTFVYTSCPGVCQGLTASLRRVQDDSVAEGYADEMAFLATTFDPEYDTPEVLREYGAEYGVDYDAGNWYFLRPEGHERAKAVVEETFGVAFELQGDGSGDGQDDDEGGEHDHERQIVHSSLILLVNKGGLVERAYSGGPPAGRTEIEDARAVVEGW